MRHIFSSGEVHYKENIKDLAEGPFIAESIEYDAVESDTEYKSIGSIMGKTVTVYFKVGQEDFEMIQYKHTIRILMQSDIFLSKWTQYRIDKNPL